MKVARRNSVGLQGSVSYVRRQIASLEDGDMPTDPAVVPLVEKALKSLVKATALARAYEAAHPESVQVIEA